MSLSIDGFELRSRFMAHKDIDAIVAELDQANSAEFSGGIRNADKKFKSIKKAVTPALIRRATKGLLASDVHLVRTILFDKSTKNNWAVGWHQDKTIAVSHQETIAGWGPWSIKDGQCHVQPSLEVLRSILTIRIHLDDVGPDNGCLRVISGSHLQGELSATEIQQKVKYGKVVNCVAARGSALLMRPLLLHSSARMNSDARRRVLHIEVSDAVLPGGLSWV